MARRPKHPDKEIDAAMVYAEQNVWIFIDPGKSAHAWGKLHCPLHTREGHKMSVWSTPRNAFNHAQQIKRLVNKCKHDMSEENQ